MSNKPELTRKELFNKIAEDLSNMSQEEFDELMEKTAEERTDLMNILENFILTKVEDRKVDKK